MLQQIGFPLPSFPVRNISRRENELSDLTNATVNISGLKVKEWENVYVFSFTFAPPSPLFIVFFIFISLFLFFVVLSMLLFYLSSINRKLLV
jgi:hypothetical protein